MESYESPRGKIIISADDFGVSLRANRNILYLISLGKIDRVGVMSHGTMTEQEIEELLKNGVKLDIHLDILHEFHEQRTKRESAVMRVLEFLGKILIGKITPKKIEIEWRSQIEEFKKLFGRNPDGINSHEHVHFFPPFFKVALKLREEYQIPYIRFGNSLNMRHHTFVSHILHWLRLINQRNYKKNECVSSTTLVSLDWISDIDKFMLALPEGTIEIACHPELAEDFVKVKKYF